MQFSLEIPKQLVTWLNGIMGETKVFIHPYVKQGFFILGGSSPLVSG